SGLFVLTLQRERIETGMLVSWVQQCSFSPPQISIALQRDRDIARLLTPGTAFTLNVLDDTQTDMIVHFGRGFGLTEGAFPGLDHLCGEGTGPVLAEALAYFTCEVSGRCNGGDHDVFIARVVAGRILGDGHPMVHVRKSGHHY